MPLRKPFDHAATTIVIGAGGAHDAPAGSGQRLVLVEPDPELVALLRRQHEGAANVTILAAAVGAADDRQELRRFSLARLNGIQAPDRLTELMPGVRPLPGLRVDGITVGTLLRELGNPKGPLHLVIDAPGSEQDILDGWKQADALGLVGSIELHAPAEPLYAASPGMSALSDWLGQEGFGICGADRTDPDWPVLWFLPETAFGVRDQLATLAAERDTAETARQAAVQKLDETQVDLAAATAERDAAVRQLDEARAGLATATAGRDTAETARQAAIQKLDDTQARLAAVTAERDTAETARKSALQKLEEGGRDLSLQMRLQAMAQLDLDDLRRSLAQSEARRREIEDLLRKLTPHLQVAAEELHRLQLVAPQADAAPATAQVAAQDPERPVAKARRRSRNG
ncbi:hypothetical protein [Pseudogemmobacter sonorensis]|uniref:hypothetical protein n=1 Tax=Pseudogemmobacter sonorensis TaxID=2989681 RepID=UPI0036CDFAA8